MQVPALERWTNLETLVLDWCDLLNHLTLSMPRLKKISLRHCKMLTSVRLRSSALLLQGEDVVHHCGRGCYCILICCRDLLCHRGYATSFL